MGSNPAYLLVAIAFAGLLAGVASWFLSDGLARLASAVASLGSFVLSALLVPAIVSHGEVHAGSLLRVDALALVFLLASTFVYAVSTLFSFGYLAAHQPDRRYGPRLLAGLNLFGWAMAVAVMTENLALIWVAIEVTTVVSALLVAIDGTDGAAEASWKYVLIASLGLGIALVATILVYAAGASVFGPVYALTYPKLLSGASHFPADTVRLSYVLAVLGFGTKVGFFPVHTWLPDAHSEAPTPVSAMLSGALLAVSFYAILRYFQVAERTLGTAFCRDVLLGFGIASLVLAAFSLLAQRDMKRLFAYSSIEHMGVLAVGASFAAPLALIGVLLHVLAHAAAKSTAFFGSGAVHSKTATKDMGALGGVVGLLPASGPMLLLAVLALSAMPPFGMFRSEFLIVLGGLRAGGDPGAAILVVLVTLAFFGMTWPIVQAMLTPSPGSEGPHTSPGPTPSAAPTSSALATPASPDLPTPTAAARRSEPSRWIVLAMAAGLVVLLVLGVHPPADLSRLLAAGARELGAGH